MRELALDVQNNFFLKSRLKAIEPRISRRNCSEPLMHALLPCEGLIESNWSGFNMCVASPRARIPELGTLSKAGDPAPR